MVLAAGPGPGVARLLKGGPVVGAITVAAVLVGWGGIPLAARRWGRRTPGGGSDVLTPPDPVAVGTGRWPPRAEDVWPTCDDPDRPPWEVRFGSSRKLRLYSPACRRRAWGHLRGTPAHEVAEFVEARAESAKKATARSACCDGDGYDRTRAKVWGRNDRVLTDRERRGAAAGAVGGAAVTLGLMTGVLPVLGPVVALGWLGTTLLNAAGGAAAVGLAGALTGWGLDPPHEKWTRS